MDSPPKFDKHGQPCLTPGVRYFVDPLGVEQPQVVEGREGKQGPRGKPGLPGAKGDKGDKGDNGAPGVSAPISFETVSKNIKAWDASFNYSSGVLGTITYAKDGLTVVKTFGYTLGKLTTLTLSGDTPNGINLVKTLQYTFDELASVTYS